MSNSLKCLSLASFLKFISLQYFLTTTFCFPLLAVEVWSNPPVELPLNVSELVHNEVKENPGSLASRTTQPLRISHFEIPIENLNLDFSEYLRPEIRDSLIIKKDGKTFVRWILNPEDQKYLPQIEKAIISVTGKQAIIRNHYVGYLTSSRSIIVQDPHSGVIFSVKGSTNSTGGIWRDKKMGAKAVRLSRAYSDFIQSYEQADAHILKHFKNIPEPAGMILASFGITIRDMEIFTNKKMRLIPFFTALSSEWGRKFAVDSGSDSPSSFWQEHLFKTWGKALAEGMSLYGFHPNSAHSQDFLLEVDEKGKLTGKIHMRDIMDSNAERTILEARNAEQLINVYETVLEDLHLKTGSVPSNAQINAFNGMGVPNWYKESFHGSVWVGFNERFKVLTGLEDGESTKLHSKMFTEFLSNLPDRIPGAPTCRQIL